MELWTVFLTGLLAGGASCAAVQGGLTGLLARRAPNVVLPADVRRGRLKARMHR